MNQPDDAQHAEQSEPDIQPHLGTEDARDRQHPHLHGHEGDDDEVAAAAPHEEHHHECSDRDEVAGDEQELVNVVLRRLWIRCLPTVRRAPMWRLSASDGPASNKDDPGAKGEVAWRSSARVLAWADSRPSTPDPQCCPYSRAMSGKTAQLQGVVKLRHVAASVGILAFGFSVAVFTPAWVVNWIYPGITRSEWYDAVANIRQATLLVLGGIVAIAGLFYTHQRHRIERDTNELARDENRTSRYSQAITQLGNQKSIDVRLGGIYALERIAQDSHRDRAVVVEVLSAFASEHIRDTVSRPKAIEDGQLWFPISRDARAVLSILGDPERPAIGSAQLRRASLDGLDLRDLILCAANLQDASLVSVNLDNAILTGSALANANLQNASLAGARLVNVNFLGADLAGASLAQANLSGALLGGAVLRSTDFSGAELTGASVRGADLSAAVGIGPSQLDGCFSDLDTVWPDGYEPAID